VAEDACENLRVLLVVELSEQRRGTYHNHCDGEQYPPTAMLLVMHIALHRDHVQQGGIPMNCLHHGLCHLAGNERDARVDRVIREWWVVNDESYAAELRERARVRPRLR